jgi:hypothetical protein
MRLRCCTCRRSRRPAAAESPPPPEDQRSIECLMSRISSWPAFTDS